jgi:hypothetical protein
VGQQQLLYILLSIIIVGIGIALSVMLFRQNAIESKRDILINECITLATMALDYYKKPTNFGGGGRSFTGWRIPNNLIVSQNGNFIADISPVQIIITGTGNEIATGSDSIKVEVTVLPNSFSTKIIN